MIFIEPVHIHDVQCDNVMHVYINNIQRSINGSFSYLNISHVFGKKFQMIDLSFL